MVSFPDGLLFRDIVLAIALPAFDPKCQASSITGM